MRQRVLSQRAKHGWEVLVWEELGSGGRSSSHTVTECGILQDSNLRQRLFSGNTSQFAPLKRIYLPSGA